MQQWPDSFSIRSCTNLTTRHLASISTLPCKGGCLLPSSRTGASTQQFDNLQQQYMLLEHMKILHAKSAIFDWEDCKAATRARMALPFAFPSQLEQMAACITLYQHWKRCSIPIENLLWNKRANLKKLMLHLWRTAERYTVICMTAFSSCQLYLASACSYSVLSRFGRRQIQEMWLRIIEIRRQLHWISNGKLSDLQESRRDHFRMTVLLSYRTRYVDDPVKNLDCPSTNRKDVSSLQPIRWCSVLAPEEKGLPFDLITASRLSIS